MTVVKAQIHPGAIGSTDRFPEIVPMQVHSSDAGTTENLFRMFRTISRIAMECTEEQDMLARVCECLISSGHFTSALCARLDQDEEVSFYHKADPTNQLEQISILLNDDILPEGYFQSCAHLRGGFSPKTRGVVTSNSGYLISALNYQENFYGLLVVTPASGPDDEMLAIVGDICDEISFALHNMTLAAEQKRARAKVERSLKEKDVLLAEIHHRVKNNLQIISGLLYLQSRRSRDDGVTDILKESLNRVRSMALIHEQLYQSRDFSRINFKDYIGRITRNLASAYSDVASTVSIRLDFDDIFFSIKAAIPCGLIINELVSNSFKHAFPAGHGQRGEIVVSLHEKDEEIEIAVEDNGIGLPDDFHIGLSESCGMEIVKMLVEQQLEGKLTVKSQDGASFRLNFLKQNLVE